MAFNHSYIECINSNVGTVFVILLKILSYFVNNFSLVKNNKW